MSGYLSNEKFKWLQNVDEFDIISICEKFPKGYLLQVDLKYPDKLNNIYPLAPLSVSSNMLSKYSETIVDKNEIKIGDVKKLISNLGNKTNYAVHYRNLQLYLSLGMKLTL